MEITKERLLALDNGWKVTIFPDTLGKTISNNLNLRFSVDLMKHGARVFLLYGVNQGVHCVNVTSMEALSQLEYYLSPYQVVDTAPMDAAIAKEFSHG